LDFEIFIIEQSFIKLCNILSTYFIMTN